MTTATDAESSYIRLDAIRQIAQGLRVTSDDPDVWRMTLVIEQLCMGTITVVQAIYEART